MGAPLTTRKVFDEMIEGIKAIKCYREAKARREHNTDAHLPKSRPRRSPRKNTK